MAEAARDQNFVPTIIGVSSLDLTTPTRVAVNPATGAVLVDSTALDARFLKLDTSNDPLTGTLQIDVPTTTSEALILKTTDDNTTKNLFEVRESGGVSLTKIDTNGFLTVGSSVNYGKVILSGPDMTNGEVNLFNDSGGGALIIDTGVTATFRMLPFGTGIFFQNTTSSGNINLTGDRGNVLTGDVIFKTSGHTTIGAAGTAGTAAFNVLNPNSAQVGQIIQAAPSQTADILNITDSSDALLLGVGSQGHMAIGEAVDADTMITVTDAAVTSANHFFGMSSTVERTNTGSARDVTGMRFNAKLAAASGTNSGDVLGIVGSVSVTGNADMTGQMKGLDVGFLHSGTGTIDTIRMISTQAGTLSGGGTITELTALFIGNVNKGDTNFAIVTNSGNIVFNEPGVSDADVRIESNNDTHQFFSDAGNDAITIGSSTNLGKFGIDGNSDVVQFVVQANATQTANLIEAQNSSGTPRFGVTPDFHIFAGNDVTASSISSLNIKEKVQKTSGISEGFGVSVNLVPGADNSVQIRGGTMQVNTQNNQTYNYTGIFRGILMTVAHQGATTGTLTTARGGDFSVNNVNTGTITNASPGMFSSSNTSTGTIENLKLVHAVTPANASGTIDNAYGLFVEDMNTATNDWAIYTNAGNVSIGDELETRAGRIKNTTRVTTTYTVLVSDEVVFANTDSAAFTATLPAGAEGQTFKIINTGSSANDLTLAPNGAEDLLGANSNFTLADGETLILTYNASDGWF